MPITNITNGCFLLFHYTYIHNSAIRFKFFKFKRYKSLQNDAIARVRNIHCTF